MRACCNIDHLYVGTFADNNRDRHERSGSTTRHHPKWKVSSLRSLPLEVLVEMAEAYDGPHWRSVNNCLRK